MAAPDPRERTAVRWFGSRAPLDVVFLTVAAPSLAVVIPGLPNDHYHAFADPMVFVLLGLGAAALARGARSPPAVTRRAVAAAGILTLCGWNLATHHPPWPRTAGSRRPPRPRADPGGHR